MAKTALLVVTALQTHRIHTPHPNLIASSPVEAQNIPLDVDMIRLSTSTEADATSWSV